MPLRTPYERYKLDIEGNPKDTSREPSGHVKMPPGSLEDALRRLTGGKKKLQTKLIGPTFYILKNTKNMGSRDSLTTQSQSSAQGVLASHVCFSMGNSRKMPIKPLYAWYSH